MKLPWITEAQIADAATYGHCFDIGQFKHEPARKRTLEWQCHRGEVVKVRAMWPWFTCGTIAKTCYVRTNRVHNPYGGFQRVASEYCCWACYRLLARTAECQLHLCDECHAKGYIAVEDTVAKETA